MADFSDIGFDGSDTDFALHLITKVGVAPVPGSSFFRHPDAGKHLVRFTFSKSAETLAEAGRRLTSL
jgi:aminotransferase